MIITVTGATGTIGRPLVDLLARWEVDVRAVTRNPERAELTTQAEVIAGDPSHPSTIAAALDGAQAVFLSPPAIDSAIEPLLVLARERGVRRAVLLSALAVEEPGPPTWLASHHRRMEDAVIASGLEWTILRPGMFAANTLAQWAAQIRAGDVVRGPYPEATDAPIHEQDVAAVAAMALVGDDLIDQCVRLTGPHSLTRAGMVRLIGQAVGRRLRYQEIPASEVRKQLTDHGVPEPLVEDMLARMARTVGRAAVVSTQVASLLGRPVHTFADWAIDHADAFTERGRA